ncbi:MAG: hypothetical protein KBS81_07570 [Spirochaetales bacterium]|nr:hypothetical protein [Candidatus Physcosoma equi]
MKQILRLLALVLVPVLFLSCQTIGKTSDNVPLEDTEATKPSFTEAIIPFYVLQPQNVLDIQVFYKDDNTQIPYLDMDCAGNLFVFLASLKGDYGINLEWNPLEENPNVVRMTKEEGLYVDFDFENDTIYFVDYDAFLASSFATSLMDVLTSPAVNQEGLPQFFLRTENSYSRYGADITFDLGNYHIDLIQTEDGLHLIPLQTFNDIFVSAQSVNLCYNGDSVFLLLASTGLIDQDGKPVGLGELYYKEQEERTEELTVFNYNELCFMLNHFYGLKKSHNIDDFSVMFFNSGLAYELLASDPEVVTAAIDELVRGIFADYHSALNAPSAYAGPGDGYKGYAKRASNYNSKLTSKDRWENARNAAFPEGCPAYLEVGDTAYITFDSFTFSGYDYYKNPPTEEAMKSGTLDTLGLIIYAHERIMREDSPIRNVVMDLTYNGGGASDAAVFAIAWFLGEAKINLEDTLTGALATTTYRADVNLDREFNEMDELTGKNLYCLISDFSFSCGNLTPAAFSTSGIVTLLGQASGGGSCVVRPASTADGTIFTFSGNNRISVVKNGAFIDADNGVSPHYFITRMENFYNREKLTEFINNLF